MEVYDSPGSGIGCCGSCGQQEWELISHEVILQLLFSTAHPLNTSNTTFFLGALYMQHACAASLWDAGRCACVFLQKKHGRQSFCATPRSVCAMLMWLYVCSCMFVEMRDEHTPGCWWDYFSWNHLNKVGTFWGETDWGEARGASAEWHPHWKWWIINKGKGTMFLISQRLSQSSARCCSSVEAELSPQAWCLYYWKWED